MVASLEAVRADPSPLDARSRQASPPIRPLLTAASHRFNHVIVDRVGFPLAGTVGHRSHPPASIIGRTRVRAA
jgi:hypothetical protein